MALSENTRVSASISTIISLVAGVAVGGSVWGIYSTRLEAVESTAEEIKKENRQLEQKQIEVGAQYAEIVRRLDRLDRKLDWYGSRGDQRDR
jgi:uncharacterized membrane-anchored protein YhcB (DUF1043 family)